MTEQKVVVTQKEESLTLLDTSLMTEQKVIAPNKSLNLFHFIDEEDLIYDNDNDNNISNIIKEDDLFTPKKLDDFLIYDKEIKECKKWFQEYNLSNKNPKILMLIGKKGCGKSLLAELLLKEFHYDKKEFNDEQLTKKQINELFKNAIHYKNLNEFKKEKTKFGFIFDNIETLLETGDNIIFNELISIIKNSKKSEIKREKNVIKNEKKSKKNKNKKEIENIQQVEENEDYENYENNIFLNHKNNENCNIVNGKNDILLYNPIICTCNYTNDKKMNELKKLCKVIDLGKPSENDLNIIVDKMSFIYHFEIKDHIKNEIYEYCEYDIRKIITAIKNILDFNNFKGVISKNEFKTYVLIYGKVDLNCQLNEATMKVLHDKITCDDANVLYSFDTLLIPLMIHHNLLNYIKNCIFKKESILKKDEEFKEKFEIYEKSLEHICIYDELQTSVYKYQERELMPQFASFFSLYVPNIYLNKMELIKNGAFKIEFTNILNKISQLEVNKKMILNSFFSSNRLIIDENELMFMIEVFLNYLKISREDVDEEENIQQLCELENDKECDKECIKEKKSRETKNKNIKNYDLENCVYKHIIHIMNKYNIDMKSLENILKIEKLNLFENKNPKRLTLKMKEEIEFYSTAQCMNIDDKNNENDHDNL